MKRKVLRLSVELLEQFLKWPIPPGLVQEGLPLDARIVHVAWEDLAGRILLLTIESEQFDLVPEGKRYPDLETRFARKA